jgi:hypothetical protein
MSVDARLPDRFHAVLPVTSILLLALALDASTALTAGAQGRAHFALGGGVSQVVGSGGSAFRPSGVVHGFLAYKLAGVPLEPRIDVQYTRHDPAGVPLGFEAGTHEEALSGLLEMQWNVLPFKKVRPYIVGGAGSTRLNSHRVSLGQWLPGNAANRFTLAGGIGARMRLGFLSGFAEAQYMHVNRDTPLYPWSEEFGSLHSVPISLGIVL